MEINASKFLEEKLREAAWYGDEEAVRSLLERSVPINAQHDINGWTPLHWAARRGSVQLVKYLLSRGADPSLTSRKGETAAAVATSQEIRRLLGESGPPEAPSLPIVPHFVSHPDCKVPSDVENASKPEDLVLKVRVAYLDDPDFVEVELHELTFANLLRTCCEELAVDVKRVVKVRKLPNTILRKDQEVRRLSRFQELELVLEDVRPREPPPARTSPYCVDGTILY